MPRRSVERSAHGVVVNGEGVRAEQQPPDGLEALQPLALARLGQLGQHVLLHLCQIALDSGDAIVAHQPQIVLCETPHWLEISC